MTEELKTLNDLKGKVVWDRTNEVIYANELKQEAIKQAKKELADMELADSINNNVWYYCAKAKYDYIVWFNNLTEEDLK